VACCRVKFTFTFKLYLFCLHSTTPQALSVIRQVTLFDYYSNAFRCSSAPSSGSVISSVNFSTRPTVSNRFPTTAMLQKSCMGSEVSFSTTRGRTVIWNNLTCWKVKSWGGSPWRYLRWAPKRVGFPVKQRDFLYEKWSI